MVRIVKSRLLLTLSALLKDNLRNRFVIFWVVIFPLIMTILFSLVFGGFSSYYHIGVVTNDIEFAKYLNSTGGLYYGILGLDKTYAILHGYIYVDITTSNISIIAPISDKEFIEPLSALIYKFVTNSNLNVSINLVKGYNYFAYLISGMVGVVALSDGILGVIGVSAGYYRDKLVERLAVSPLSSLDWTLSIIFYTIIITFISTLLIFLLGVIYGFLPLISLEFLAFLVVSTLMFGGLGAIIYGLTPKDKIFLSEVVANVFVFPLIFLSNAFFPISAYPHYIKAFVEYQPLSLVVTVIRDVTVYNESPPLTYIIALVGMTVAFVLIGTRLLRLREFE